MVVACRIKIWYHREKSVVSHSTFPSHRHLGNGTEYNFSWISLLLPTRTTKIGYSTASAGAGAQIEIFTVSEQDGLMLKA
jgi:hypothetical protein